MKAKIEEITIFPTPKNGVIGYFLSDTTSLLPSKFFGTHNGYVILDHDHPLSGMDYDDIHQKYDIEVHGGMTFSAKLSLFQHIGELTGSPILADYRNYWVLGFDTKHAGDNAENWNKENTLKETKAFVEQLMNIGE